MYADDIKIFRVIESPRDTNLLQDDLNSVVHWLHTNYMNVSAEKSAVITYSIGGSKDRILKVYKCNDTVITRKDSIQDLGVIFDANFSFRDHVDKIIAKLNILYYILKNYLYVWNVALTALIIRTYVRPVIEYCSCVWSSCPSRYKTYSDRLDKSINRFTKLCKDISSFDCDLRLNLFGLPTLKYRRVRGDCITFFNIIHGNNHVLNKNDFFMMSNNCTRNNGCKIFKPRVGSSSSLHFFPYRNIDCWNKLSYEVVNANNVTSFKILFDNCKLSF